MTGRALSGSARVIHDRGRKCNGIHMACIARGAGGDVRRGLGQCFDRRV